MLKCWKKLLTSRHTAPNRLRAMGAINYHFLFSFLCKDGRDGAFESRHSGKWRDVAEEAGAGDGMRFLSRLTVARG